VLDPFHQRCTNRFPRAACSPLFLSIIFAVFLFSSATLLKRHIANEYDPSVLPALEKTLVHPVRMKVETSKHVAVM
jgi:hypothetical protein